MVHPRLRLRDTQFQGGDVTSHCWISRSDAGGSHRRHTIYQAEKLGVTRPEQLFLRSYGDSRGANYYAQYLRGVSEASAQARGAKSPR